MVSVALLSYFKLSTGGESHQPVRCANEYEYEYIIVMLLSNMSETWYYAAKLLGSLCPFVLTAG